MQIGVYATYSRLKREKPQRSWRYVRIFPEQDRCKVCYSAPSKMLRYFCARP